MTKGINEVEMKIPENREDLIRAAVSHDETCISVGGLAMDLGILTTEEFYPHPLDTHYGVAYS